RDQAVECLEQRVDHGLGGAVVEQIPAVSQSDSYARSGDHREIERVVGGVAALEVRDLNTGPGQCGVVGETVHGVVLDHHGGVEQLAAAGTRPRPDIDQAVELVFQDPAERVPQSA